MTAVDSFIALRDQLKKGNAAAAAEVFARYGARLVALVRPRLAPRLRSKLDPEDVVQSAFRSFFLGCATGRFDFPDSEHLWSLLALITLRKCHRQAELFRADCRDVRREAADGPAGDAASLLAGGPTPQEVVATADLIEQVRTRLGSPLKRSIFELTLDGYSVTETAAAVDYYERGVERARAEARAILNELMQAEPMSPG